VTRGRLPQKAGSLGLNGGGATATVPPSLDWYKTPETKVTTTKSNPNKPNNHARKLLPQSHKLLTDAEE